uniref:MEG-14 n=1 Tax=Schistosoma mansoni TaxID=6183 RepID=A0A5K4F8M2_SCHMA
MVTINVYTCILVSTCIFTSFVYNLEVSNQPEPLKNISRRPDFMPKSRIEAAINQNYNNRSRKANSTLKRRRKGAIYGETDIKDVKKAFKTFRKGRSPTSASSTSGPTSASSTSGPTSASSTSGPTSASSTSGPTSASSTSGPTSASSTSGPTSASSTSGPTSASSTSGPTSASSTSVSSSASSTFRSYSYNLLFTRINYVITVLMPIIISRIL